MVRIYAESPPNRHGVLLDGSATRCAAEDFKHLFAELQRGAPLGRFPLQQLHDGLPELPKLLLISCRDPALLPRQRLVRRNQLPVDLHVKGPHQSCWVNQSG
jgi:hypothetical protein